MKFRVTRRDALRGSVAGTQGHAARCAAQALFEAGGRGVLPAPVQSAVGVAVAGVASRVLAAVGLLESGATTTAQLLEGGAARAVAAQTARAAGRQILESLGAAAGAGAVIDGGRAPIQAVRGVRRGSMTQRPSGYSRRARSDHRSGGHGGWGHRGHRTRGVDGRRWLRRRGLLGRRCGLGGRQGGTRSGGSTFAPRVRCRCARGEREENAPCA